MFLDTPAFSSFSVKDQAAAKAFYTDTLGLEVDEDDMGLHLQIDGGQEIFVYVKPDHAPASFTILNFPVDDIDEAVNALKERGVTFESYQGMTDENGIARGIAAKRGPDIAWFKDPAGNILSVLQNA
jgi:catechol 2,3-dioxygenase-like lactoylglutathione lyase family enzyme